MNKTHAHISKAFLCALSLTVLGGCDFFGKSTPSKSSHSSSTAGDGVVLCTINNEPVIRESDFLSSLNQMIQANPYFKGASADALPKELQRKFFEQLTTQALIEKYATKNNIEKDPEFIKAYEETERLLKRSLMVQMFEKTIYENIKVSDADIQKHYEENKDRFVKSAGGVLVAGARFDSDDAAAAFLAKAKSGDFEKLAKAEKGAKYRDFGRVAKEARNPQYDVVPGPIKDSALALNSLPGFDKVKVGKEHWVIKVWDKKDSELFDLAEIKQHIESMLKNNMFRDELEKRLKTIKDEFKITVNEEYFKEKDQPQAADNASDKKETEDVPATAA